MEQLMVEMVTVVVDGTPQGDAAVAWAMDRARAVPTQLEMIAVEQVRGRARRDDVSYPLDRVLFDAAATVEAAVPGLSVTRRLRHGLFEEQLIQASTFADLLVIGTTPRSSMASIVHGTLAMRVAGRTACTTVAVPSGWANSGGGVVVGWSDDPTAHAALAFAAREAAQCHAELTIVHAWTPPHAAPVGVAVPPHALQEHVAREKRVLADALHRVESEYPDVVATSEVTAGSAAVAIVRAASAAGLIVIGSRGRGEIARFFLGSVSRDILLNLPVPVAVVPHHADSFGEPRPQERRNYGAGADHRPQ
jgi:nucleotide-binding universal stress UspA family protein